MADKTSLTLSRAIEQVLARVQEPISVDDFAKRVLAIYPSRAKNPLATLRSRLRLEYAGETLAFLDRQTLIPLRLAMQGVRFRIFVSRQEATQGVLLIDPAFDSFRRSEVALQDMQLLDAAGHPLNVPVGTLKQQVKGPLGAFTHENPVFELGDWFRTHRIRRHDSVLVTVEDWARGCFRLEHEPARNRRQMDIERQNRELADLLFDLLEAARDERLYSHRAIPTAYARLSEPRGYPGDHWIEVIANDPRMTWTGFDIQYSDVHSPFEAMLAPEEEYRRPETPYSQEQARQVYRFKAILWHRPAIWRRLEIQGGQSLADFDDIIRDAFQHDTADHMGGFWKLVRRGSSQRFREVDLGSINPFGEGDGADLHVAGLGLEPGDELKYVYDFGDWIEHRLTLEKIDEPEAAAQFPRIIDQNKPRYQHCQVCKGKRRKTVATWICIECSNAKQQDVLLCEACLMDEHEDHYAEEVIY